MLPPETDFGRDKGPGKMVLAGKRVPVTFQKRFVALPGPCDEMQDRAFRKRVKELSRPVFEIRDRFVGLKQDISRLDHETHPQSARHTDQDAAFDPVEIDLPEKRKPRFSLDQVPHFCQK